MSTNLEAKNRTLRYSETQYRTESKIKVRRRVFRAVLCRSILLFLFIVRIVFPFKTATSFDTAKLPAAFRNGGQETLNSALLFAPARGVGSRRREIVPDKFYRFSYMVLGTFPAAEHRPVSHPSYGRCSPSDPFSHGAKPSGLLGVFRAREEKLPTRSFLIHTRSLLS